jgi:hypothetical protein
MVLPDIIQPDDVPNLLTLVAPGFFAYAGYAAVFPQRSREELPVLVTSVALSLPLVALTRAFVSGFNATKLAHVTLLLGLSFLAGYLVALARGTGFVRRMLGFIGYRNEPESTVLGRILQRLPQRTLVTVSFKDGRKVSGNPKYGTAAPEAEVRELYLSYPAWWNPTTQAWEERRAEGGVLVSLDEVQAIDLLHAPPIRASRPRNLLSPTPRRS